MNRLKLINTFLLLFVFCTSCNQNKKKEYSLVSVEIKNHNLLDSLIIYDQKKSWKVESTFRFNQSNSIEDTLQLDEKKFYKIYSFIDGNQDELGELLLAKNSTVQLILDETNPFESIRYNGSFELVNNFLAFSKKSEHFLTTIVREGIDQNTLKNEIGIQKDLIIKEANLLHIEDSIETYRLDKFDTFSEVLLKKNKKYNYKRSLIDSIGNKFVFKNIENEDIELSNYKGSYVYIDVWATWCKPCKVEYPFLKELEEYFQEQENVVILSISTDKDFEKWRKYIKTNKHKGIHLYSGAKSDFVSFYDIGALPRFILLDKNGKVLNPDEIRPSNPELKIKINQLLQSDDNQ